MRALGFVAAALALAGCSRAPRQDSILVTPEPPRATPDTRAAREAHVAEALARAPHLNRAAAALLAEGADRRHGAWGDPMDASLLEAARGFSRLDPADLKELGTLFGEVYGDMLFSGRRPSAMASRARCRSFSSTPGHSGTAPTMSPGPVT